MLCPLCGSTPRSWTCLDCQRKYEADVRAGRIPEPLTAESYDYTTWVQVQLLKRRGIANNLPDEVTVNDVQKVAAQRAEQYAKILQSQTAEEERQKRLREGLADKNRFNF